MFLLLPTLFVIWKLFIFISALLAPLFLPLHTESIAHSLAIGHHYLTWIWVNFDGIHYLSIAKTGYHYPNYAFFPLFPMLTELVNDYFRLPRILAGLWISNISFFLGLVILYKITLLDFNKKIALRTLIFALVVPTSFFYGAFYADALYFFLSVLSFYNARRSRWLIAGIFGYLAGLDRLIGATLFPVLLLEWYLQNKDKLFNAQSFFKHFIQQKAFFIFLVPLGIITYGAYLQINHGNFFLFQEAMKDWGQSKIIFPPQVFWRYIKIFFTAQHNYIYFIALLEFASTILYCYLMLRSLKILRSSYILLMFLVVLIPTFTGTLQGMPRYILHMFPAFIAIALLTASSKKYFYALLVLFIILQAILVAFFTRGYFVA